MNAYAQNSLPEKSDDVLLNRLRVRNELQKQVEEQMDEQPQIGGQKSIGKAVLFSAIVPGTGQFYSESYLTAAGFLAAEIAAWAINISYDKKGDDKTVEFEQFADQNWSEQRYWSYVYYRVKDDDRFTEDPSQFQIDNSNPDKPIITNWQEVEADLEKYANSDFLPGFTHHLPETKTQQYYEMIGKYPEQFGNAWADASFNASYNGYQGRITEQNDIYTDMRADANRFYDIAGYGTMVAVVNHVVSAVHAGFITKKFNDRSLQMTYENKRYLGEYVDMFGLRVSF